MKLYSRKYHRNVERKVHFGIGKSVKTACGLVLFSRYVMGQLGDDSDGAIITADISRVTCRRCLAIKEVKLRKLIEIEAVNPGIFDRGSLCGEEWLLSHALDISRDTINNQKLELVGVKQLTLSNTMRVKDRKEILKRYVK